MGSWFKTSQAPEVNLVIGEDRLGLAAVKHANSMFELTALAQVKREASVSLAILIRVGHLISASIIYLVLHFIWKKWIHPSG